MHCSFLALMQCRSDEPRFHRAAFRLSQALNWALLFQNPDCTPLGPETSRALIAEIFSIPGFDAGSFEQNAALVMGSLFDKRRQVPLSVISICHFSTDESVLCSSFPSVFLDLNYALFG